MFFFAITTKPLSNQLSERAGICLENFKNNPTNPLKLSRMAEFSLNQEDITLSVDGNGSENNGTISVLSPSPTLTEPLQAVKPPAAVS